MDDYWRDFVQESEEHITELNNSLLTLERAPMDDDAMEAIFRTAHTLKGNCGAMGLTRASNLAHAIEDLLDAVRAGDVDVSADLMDTIFEGVDELERMIDDVADDGEIHTDPSATIEALREPLDESATSMSILTPTEAEIDATLAQFDPPADPEHDTFFVRLSITEPAQDSGADPRDDDVNNGILVVDALIDAFDLVGTDPPRETIEDRAYDGTVDAVFGSAVGEAAIAAALEPVDAVDDFEIVTVTDRFDRLADSEAATDESDAEDDALASTEDITSEDAQDLSVDELLDEFSEFDDLDAMVEEIDDVEAFDEMGDAGSFHDLLGEDGLESVAGEPAETDAASTDATAGESGSSSETDTDVGTDSDAGGSDGTGHGDDGVVSGAEDDEDEVDDASAVFAELKEEVEMVGFDELQAELDQLEFDEFDSDDEVGMDELLGDDVDVTDNSFLNVSEEEAEAEVDAMLADLEGEDDDDAGEADLEGEEDDDAGEADLEGEDGGVDDLAGEESAVDAATNRSERFDDVSDTGDDASPTDGGTEAGSVAVESEPDAAHVDPVSDTAPASDSEPDPETDADASVGGENENENESENEAEAAAEPTNTDADADDIVATDDAFEAFTFDDDIDDEPGDTDEADADETVREEMMALDGVDFGDAGDDLDSDGDTDLEVEASDADAESSSEEESDLEGDSTDSDYEDEAASDLDAEESDAELEFDDGFDDELADFGEVDEEFDDGFDEVDGDFDDDEFDVASDLESMDDFEQPESTFDPAATAVDVSPETSSADDVGFEAEFDADADEFETNGVDTGTDESTDDTESGRVTSTGIGGEDGLEIPDITIPEVHDRPSAERQTDSIQSVRVDVEQIDSLLNLVEGLVTSRVRLRHAFESGEDPATIDRELDDLEDLTSELQETVMDVRLVPLQTVANRLPRVVRDIARDQDKEVAFELTGEDVELDRSILDRIGDPLIHLVRNAVDHGIEPPEEREEAGKPREGTVELRADRSRDRVTIEVEDDGSGLDPDRLRNAAVEADVLTEAEAADLDDDEALELVFHPGLSTAEEVTDVSGRGVGMDVVKRTVEELDGTVSIESELGDGTMVTMALPVTVAIADVLFVESGGEEFGIPTKVVQDIEDGRHVQTVDGRAVLADGTGEHGTGGDGETANDDGSGTESDADRDRDGDDQSELPVIDLADVLETPGNGANANGMVVRIRDDVRPIGLRCNQVHGQQEVVIKPFEGFMSGIPGISGATVRGRGEVVNILDVNTL